MVRYVRLPVGVRFSVYGVWKRMMKSKLAASKPIFSYSEGKNDIVHSGGRGSGMQHSAGLRESCPKLGIKSRTMQTSSRASS